MSDQDEVQKETMPKRGINRTQPVQFFPNKVDDFPYYNRKERRSMEKVVRNFRGNETRKRSK